MRKTRKAIPSSEKGNRVDVNKIVADNSESSENDTENSVVGEKEEVEKVISKNIFVPLIKANKEERTVTGVVLQPEVVDAQGDIMSAEVIRKAAHKFLARYNKATELGLMHKFFGKYKFELFQSWVAPQDVVINGTTVKNGSWIMTVYVGDDKIWKMVKSAKLKGFSIAGKARAKKIDDKAAA